jgi:hypothetical protein
MLVLEGEWNGLSEVDTKKNDKLRESGRERERERERENIFLFNFTYCFEFTVIVLNVFGQQSFIPLFFFRTCYKWQDPLSKENVRTSSKVTLLLVVGKKFR